MYVFTYVRMNLCTYVRMYFCTFVRLYVARKQARQQSELQLALACGVEEEELIAKA